MNWQQQAVQFATEHDLKHEPQIHLLDLVSEVGEVAKEMLLASNYGAQDAVLRPELAEELGDLLYSLCLLADSAEIDLDQALQQTLQKYQKRWQAQGHTGSQPTS